MSSLITIQVPTQTDREYAELASAIHYSNVGGNLSQLIRCLVNIEANRLGLGYNKYVLDYLRANWSYDAFKTLQQDYDKLVMEFETLKTLYQCVVESLARATKQLREIDELKSTNKELVIAVASYEEQLKQHKVRLSNIQNNYITKINQQYLDIESLKNQISKLKAEPPTEELLNYKQKYADLQLKYEQALTFIAELTERLSAYCSK